MGNMKLLPIAIPTKWVLRYLPDGNFHRLERSSGYTTLARTANVWEAHQFGEERVAVAWKNNESHVRHLPMELISLSFANGINSHGLVPLQDPHWDGDFDRDYDQYRAKEFAKIFREVYEHYGKIP